MIRVLYVRPSTYFLYRLFDKRRRLLYIGTGDFGRIRSHHGNAQWFEQVVTIKLERFASRPQAREAERLAIIRERPVWNKQHNSTV